MSRLKFFYRHDHGAIVVEFPISDGCWIYEVWKFALCTATDIGPEIQPTVFQMLRRRRGEIINVAHEHGNCGVQVGTSDARRLMFTLYSLALWRVLGLDIRASPL